MVDLPPAVNNGDVAWVIVATAFVFAMHIGLGFFYAGLARAKHALSLMFLMLLSVAVVSLQWYLLGYSLTFSETGSRFIGDLTNAVGRGIGMKPNSLAPSIPSSMFFVFQLMFASITPALAFGSSAERMRIAPAIVFLFVWETLVYDVITSWVWGPNGWLKALGVMDFAGGTPVHIASGLAAVAYAIVVGKRRDYVDFNVPHSPSFVFLGTGFLWFGWFGFNGGSSLTADARGVQALISTHLSGCVGGLAWILMDYRLKRKWSMIGFCTGAVAGLATITPASGYVTSASSLAFGFLGGIICNLAVTYKHKYNFDDALDVFAVHYVGGIVGLILTGVFAQRDIVSLSYPPGAEVPLGGWLDGNWMAVPIQLAAIASVSAWSFVVTYIILFVMNKIPGLHLRLCDQEEAMGTDEVEIGEKCYNFSPADLTLLQEKLLETGVLKQLLSAGPHSMQSVSSQEDADTMASEKEKHHATHIEEVKKENGDV
ncbi:uncharacterized protein VTP21DRAFT_8716 [Calcarisporiella thermophila]|uniref:uncharacterized protein n=1 Tax=Calcarisporiella thermophila TaxID=911321 RepID=UPI0037448830